MGVVRMLDAGTISMQDVRSMLIGQDLSELTDIWNSESAARRRRERG